MKKNGRHSQIKINSTEQTEQSNAIDNPTNQNYQNKDFISREKAIKMNQPTINEAINEKEKIDYKDFIYFKKY